jgi:trans-2-enoyl-CoA reductase
MANGKREVWQKNVRKWKKVEIEDRETAMLDSLWREVIDALLEQDGIKKGAK